jgi:LPXTG-motif cell wall-anchored protein
MKYTPMVGYVMLFFSLFALTLLVYRRRRRKENR